VLGNIEDNWHKAVDRDVGDAPNKYLTDEMIKKHHKEYLKRG